MGHDDERERGLSSPGEPAFPPGLNLIERIPPDWRDPTLEIAERLRAAGYRAWIVGGGVRDLLLGLPIKDIDLVSAALPDEVEALFEKTVAVGKAFGIVVVVLGGKEIEVATFREERGYSDRRRPDEIVYATSPAVDAKRRDFTCNALYLDPLTGDIEDPAQGLPDLESRRLQAVGDPVHRFREDGLRLLRAARFMAALDLDPAPGLEAAMAAERDSIAGVSPERVHEEIAKVLRGPSPCRAMEMLVQSGVLDLCLPGWEAADASIRTADLRAALEPGTSSGPVTDDVRIALGLAILLDPKSEDAPPLADALDRLRVSKDRRRTGLKIAELRDRILHLCDAPAPTDEVSRGERIALHREPLFPPAARWAAAADARVAPLLEALAVESASAPAEPVQVTAQDVQAAGIDPGPAMGAALRSAQHAALAGAFTDRAGAIRWLVQEQGR